jgi:hypothetical protein
MKLPLGLKCGRHIEPPDSNQLRAEVYDIIKVKKNSNLRFIAYNYMFWKTYCFLIFDSEKQVGE